MLAIELADGVNIGDELIASGECPSELDLQVLLGIRDPNPILPDEPFEQVNSLMQQPIPGFPFAIFKGSVAKDIPFLEKAAVQSSPLKVSSEAFQSSGQRPWPRGYPFLASRPDSGSDSCAGSADIG